MTDDEDTPVDPLASLDQALAGHRTRIRIIAHYQRLTAELVSLLPGPMAHEFEHPQANAAEQKRHDQSAGQPTIFSEGEL